MVKAKKAKKVIKRARAVRPPPRETDVITEVQSLQLDVETLAEEMRSWADNIEEKFSHTQKYENVNEAATILEGIDLNFGYDELSIYTMEIQDPKPQRRQPSRAARASAIAETLRDVIERLGGDDIKKEHRESADAYIADLKNAADELDELEFPGMFG